MRVLWTDLAEADLDAVVMYVAEESVSNALALDDRIREWVRMLADFPYLGHAGRVEGTLELSLPHDRCVVVYRIQDELVRVLRLIHGGQQWPLYYDAPID